jgi:hypothetical protein
MNNNDEQIESMNLVENPINFENNESINKPLITIGGEVLKFPIFSVNMRNNEAKLSNFLVILEKILTDNQFTREEIRLAINTINSLPKHITASRKYANKLAEILRLLTVTEKKLSKTIPIISVGNYTGYLRLSREEFVSLSFGVDIDVMTKEAMYYSKYYNSELLERIFEQSNINQLSLAKNRVTTNRDLLAINSNISAIEGIFYSDKKLCLPVMVSLEKALDLLKIARSNIISQ